MKRKVVITGMGVVAPNGVGLKAFHAAQQEGRSGIRLIEQLRELGFSCQVGGIPAVSEEDLNGCMNALEQRMIVANSIRYGVISAHEAWQDAGMEWGAAERSPDTGIIFGAGISGVDKFRDAIYKVDEGKVRRLGSTVVINTMASGISAFLSGKIGAGNMVTTNSSACVTGTESVMMGYERIAHGDAEVMLVGSTSEDGPYIWGGFDAMRVMNYRHNEEPQAASRPLSASAGGFVPGSGAAALVLESEAHAVARGARIYAEILGGAINSGGHRNGGTMTAPNGQAVQECIRLALKNTGVTASEIDYINGHLTATSKDGFEIANWIEALGVDPKNFPPINSTKSTIGHCLSASGSIEFVATLLQMENGVIYPSVNCSDLHEEVQIIDKSIPKIASSEALSVCMSASFGFGDVNGVLVVKKG